jgi:hypothetical protein
VRLDEILVAHSFLKVERPPELWEADTDDERFLFLLGEMIVVGLGRASRLGELTLNVANVSVEPEEDEEEEPWLEPGDYVAVTIRGPGSWSDDVWRAGEGPTTGPLSNVAPRADDAGAVYAYARDLGADGGSATVFLPRLVV